MSPKIDGFNFPFGGARAARDADRRVVTTNLNVADADRILHFDVADNTVVLQSTVFDSPIWAGQAHDGIVLFDFVQD